jgi:hypothetical protein
MRVPNFNTTPTEVIRIGQDHLDRMAPVSELAPMSTRFQAVQSVYVADNEAWRAAQSPVRTAMSHRDACVATLANVLHTAITAVHNKTNRRRKPGITDPHFPDGLGPYLKTIGALTQRASVLLATLQNEQDPVLTALIDPLKTAIDDVTSAIDDLETARAAVRAARGVLMADRRQWDTAYRHDYYDLKILYAGVAGKAESFFLNAPAQPSPQTPSQPVVSKTTAGDVPTSNTSAVTEPMPVPQAPAITGPGGAGSEPQ